jgi:hypothetical protein
MRVHNQTCNDPIVLAHARALLANTTPEGVTSYVDADVHDPERILADARTVVNFSQPVAVMFMNVLGLVADLDEARSIVAHVMAAAPAGSYLALRDGATTRRLIPRLFSGRRRPASVGRVGGCCCCARWRR